MREYKGRVSGQSKPLVQGAVVHVKLPTSQAQYVKLPTSQAQWVVQMVQWCV